MKKLGGCEVLGYYTDEWESCKKFISETHHWISQDVERRGVQLLEGFAQDAKGQQRKIAQGMEMQVELAFAEYAWDIERLAKKLRGRSKLPPQ